MKQLPFSIVESEYFINPFMSANSTAAELISKDGDTIRAWIQQKYKPAKAEMVVLLSESRSSVHLAADIWTSPNALAILGVVAHWMMEDGSRKSILLELSQMREQHNGEHIADEMVNIIESFGLVQKLGYFLTDNATNNDCAIRILGKKYGFTLDERRLRCLAHIINLAVHNLLNALFDSVISLSQTTSIDSPTLHAPWQTPQHCYLCTSYSSKTRSIQTCCSYDRSLIPYAYCQQRNPLEFNTPHSNCCQTTSGH
jgi:hypothetical protein